MRDGLSYSEAGRLGGLASIATVRAQKTERIRKYNENPKFCTYCDQPLTYENRRNKFCNRSCAASWNNRGKNRWQNIEKETKEILPRKVTQVKTKRQRRNRKRYDYPERICKGCGKVGLKTSRKEVVYCSAACVSHQRKLEIVKRIENGDTTLYIKHYRNYLIEKYGAKCFECGWDKINPVTKKCPIELEHKDGNSENNSLDNLSLLCPNCHSLTPTYKALNKGRGRHFRLQRYKQGKSY